MLQNFLANKKYHFLFAKRGVQRGSPLCPQRRVLSSRSERRREPRGSLAEVSSDTFFNSFFCLIFPQNLLDLPNIRGHGSSH